MDSRLLVQRITDSCTRMLGIRCVPEILFFSKRYVKPSPHRNQRFLGRQKLVSERLGLGRRLPRISVTFEVFGAATLTGPKTVTAVDGMAQTTIQTSGAPGDVVVMAYSNGLKDGFYQFTIR